MNTAITSYKHLCANEEIENNSEQEKLIHELNNFFYVNEKSFLRNIFSFTKKKKNKNCFYIYGKVGIGKTLIMDIFFNDLKVNNKNRFHFHEFMINTHDNFHELRKNNQDNKEFLISTFAKNLSKKTKFLFFDEFQVTNIADAMILGHLFNELFRNNVQILITSNNHPDDLYKEGLQKELFLPFIQMIKEESIVYDLDIDTDYRKKNLDLDEVYFASSSSASTLKIDDIHNQTIHEYKLENKIISFKKRDFVIKRFANKSARFNFDELCGVEIGVEDYLQLIRYIDTIFIENVPDFSDINSNQQERFINLIDVLYDNQVNLIMSSEKKIEDINSAHYLKDKFMRTKSRLSEMKSKSYRYKL